MTDRPDPAAWIAKRRELLDAATEGPWSAATGALVGDDEDEATHVWHRTYLADRAWMTVGKVLDNDMDQTTIEDAEFIADARTSLPRALDALEAALKGHRPVSFSFSWQTGVTMHEVCGTCQDKAGVHPCGCWRDEDVSHLCAVCSDPEHRMEAPWPCMTVHAIATALGVEPTPDRRVRP